MIKTYFKSYDSACQWYDTEAYDTWLVRVGNALVNKFVSGRWREPVEAEVAFLLDGSLKYPIRLTFECYPDNLSRNIIRIWQSGSTVPEIIADAAALNQLDENEICVILSRKCDMIISNWLNNAEGYFDNDTQNALEYAESEISLYDE